MEKMVKHNKNTSVYAGKRDYGILALFVATLAVGLFIGFAFTSISDSCTTGQYLWPNFPKNLGGYGGEEYSGEIYKNCVCWDFFGGNSQWRESCQKSSRSTKYVRCGSNIYTCSTGWDCFN